MRFNEEQKKKLVRMINERILNHNEKIIFFHRTIEHLHHKYTLKFSDDKFDIDIFIYDHFQHKDIEIDIHDKILNKSLIFDSHQYFINPKDIKMLINSLIDLYHSEEEEKETDEILKKLC